MLVINKQIIQLLNNLCNFNNDIISIIDYWLWIFQIHPKYIKVINKIKNIRKIITQSVLFHNAQKCIYKFNNKTTRYITMCKYCGNYIYLSKELYNFSQLRIYCLCMGLFNYDKKLL